ncbi:uncharacterized protein HKW66_Vig0079930 [Vigna angularis]|uniref:Ubiquitin-like protease family profile domain-containing protein n=1 Tax=Phaseolus angularis TaxID=3914 RepID=A0A8T0KNQ4_PHAAN|nr:uncharacterized protein HKW66_Vig0079930 [Vigna angularis]
MSQETLRQMDLQWEERLNQSMRSMEQRFMEQLQEQKEIQRALEEKLHSMRQGNMGTAESPTPPRVSTRGSCSTVEPTQYSGQYELLVDGDPPRIVVVGRVLEGGQTIHGVPILPQHVRFTRPQKQPIHDTIIHEDDDMAEAEDDPLSKLMTKLPRYMDTIVVDQGRSSMYGFVEPQTIRPSGNTLQNRQHYLQTWMDESKRDVYLVPYIDGLHWQLMVIIPKACKIIWFCSLHRKMKNDLRTMLQGVIGKSRGQLVQILYPKVCFKSTSPIPEDTIRQIRQELTAYLLQRWMHKPTSNPTPSTKPFRHMVVEGYTSDVCTDVGGRRHRTFVWTSEGCTLDVYVDVRDHTPDV